MLYDEVKAVLNTCLLGIKTVFKPNLKPCVNNKTP